LSRPVVRNRFDPIVPGEAQPTQGEDNSFEDNADQNRLVGGDLHADRPSSASVSRTTLAGGARHPARRPVKARGTRPCNEFDPSPLSTTPLSTADDDDDVVVVA
jgi:hypothetical protein